MKGRVKNSATHRGEVAQAKHCDGGEKPIYKRMDSKSILLEKRRYLSTLSKDELADYISNYTKNANATYEENLKKLGIVSLDSPSQIRIYPKDFESKENIVSGIDEYNKLFIKSLNLFIFKCKRIKYIINIVMLF